MSDNEIGTPRAVDVLRSIADELDARLVVVRVETPDIVEPPAFTREISVETRLLWGE